jgi:hypothetical protein
MEQSGDHPERRIFSRIPLNGKVTLIADHSRWTANLLDISMKGVLISHPAEWHGKKGDPAQLQINLSNSTVVITMDATLTHSSAEFLGFRCEHIDLDSMTHLRRLLELNLGDEERINRELSALVYMHNNNSGGR